MIVGMDFGTTNSGMSVYDGQRLQLIPLDHANRNPHVARTALYITNRRRVYMGREAVEKYYEQNINRKVKYQRVWVGEISLEYAELPVWVRDVTIDKDVLSPGRLFLSFKTGLRSPTYLGTVVGSQFYLLEDIVALYLYIARLRAEETLQTDLRRIVLGRPVHFSLDPEQDRLAAQRLVHAAFLAGYDEVYLQPEPIAAAHFYETSIDRPENVLIFDFGGGTLDITIARLGDPAERAILATGGVPIAGDVFDQKLVRANLPRHFGEGSHYRSDMGTILPVPASLFEAFADWQELLELNKPDFLRMIEQMAETAQKRRQILMLHDLITSSYSLKMFDAVEATKRDLSSKIISMINLDGPGFRVQQPVTRHEFELLIEDDVQTITAELDAVIARAGLRPAQIDAVIRTGGSAQIPAFIDLLEQRFGPEKVREIDTFSSVTSGLGILGHQIEDGSTMVDLPVYRRDAWAYGTRLRQNGVAAHDDTNTYPAENVETMQTSPTGAPKVDLDLIKQFIDLEERQAETDDEQVCLLAITAASDIQAVTVSRQRFAGAHHDGTEIALADLGDFDSRTLETVPNGAHLIATAPENRALLMTSEYRFLLRHVGDLAELAAVGMNLAEMESFYADKFGREVVRGIVAWDALQGAERIGLVSSKGEIKMMYGDALLESLDQLHPYQLDRLAGEPVALIPADTPELVIITNAGSVARLHPDDLITGTQRAIRLRKDERVMAAFALDRPTDLLLCEANGRGKRVHTRAIPFSNGSDLGTKTLSRRALRTAIPLGGTAHASDAPMLWAITTRRLIPLDRDSIPMDPPTPPNSRAILRLRKGESLLALQFFA